MGIISGANINSSTFGKGNGGKVTLKARESVVFAEEGADLSSNIAIITTDTENNAGDAGKLMIEANDIFLTGGSWIAAFTNGKGNGGEVSLNASDMIVLSGTNSKGIPSYVYAVSNTTDKDAGAGGKISVSAQKLQVSDKGKITTSSIGGGQAGDIALNIGSLEMSGGASVSSDTTLSGGRITVNAEDTVHLTDSRITTNVAQGNGRGGDIAIGNPDTGIGSEFVILNNSRIQANVGGNGDGGAVFIITDNFLKSFNSIIEATSARGNEGTVKIEAPDFDISGELTVMPGTFFDAKKWVYDSCESRSGKVRGRFTIRRYFIPPDLYEP